MGFMSCYFSRTDKGGLRGVEARVRGALKTQGFGVLTEIDVKATRKTKLDVEFHPRKIPGACNPLFAHGALPAEDKIGTMLPCNVILREESPGEVEVAAVDPLSLMRAVDNPQLGNLAHHVRDKFRAGVEDFRLFYPGEKNGD
jgi:uncharacterized protein (DUF302 family)